MKLFFALVAAVLLSVPAFSIPTIQETELTPLPEINLQDFDGKKVAAGELKGNILVLDFWATWCVPCLAEIPVWNNLQQKYLSAFHDKMERAQSQRRSAHALQCKAYDAAGNTGFSPSRYCLQVEHRINTGNS